MADPHDEPNPQAEFDALMKAQLSDVAEAGRRIERAHRKRPSRRKRGHLRLVRSGPRPARASRIPLPVQYLIAVAIVAAVVVISLAFPTPRFPHAAPLARPDVVVAGERLFPAQVTGADRTAYQRHATDEVPAV